MHLSVVTLALLQVAILAGSNYSLVQLLSVLLLLSTGTAMGDGYVMDSYMVCLPEQE